MRQPPLCSTNTAEQVIHAPHLAKSRLFNDDSQFGFVRSVACGIIAEICEFICTGDLCVKFTETIN